MRRARPDASAFRTVAAVALVSGLGLVLRCTALDGPSFKLWDDFFSLRLAVLDPGGIVHSLLHQSYDPYQEFQPPLYYLLVHAVFAWLGQGDVQARLVGVLAGSLTVPMLYVFGRRLFGRKPALVAALLLAVSLFHIEYSQQIRNYVPFLLLALASMHLFLRSLERGGAAVLVGHALATAAMLYTSYAGCVVAAAQGAIWGLDVGLAVRTGPRAALRARLGPALSLAAAGLAYLPWLPVQARMMAVLKAVSNPSTPSVWRTLVTAGRDFFANYCDFLGYPNAALPLAGLVVVGAVLALTSDRRRPGTYLLVWVGLTLAAVFGFNRQGLHVRSRHLIVLLPVLYLFAGLAAWRLGELVGGLGRRPWATWAAVLALVLGLNSFNLRALPFFYRREDDRLKDLCHAMAFQRRDTDRADFWGGDSKWFPAVADFVRGWYLPGAFRNLSDGFDRRYQRTYLLSAPGVREALAGTDNVRHLARFASVDLNVAGIVNTSPLVLAVPPEGGTVSLREDFSGVASLGRVHHLDNLALDRGRTAQRDLSRPASLTYALAAPEGAGLREVTATFQAVLVADVSGVPDSRLSVSVGSERGGLVPVAEYRFRDLASRAEFDGRSLLLEREVRLPEAGPESGARLVRFDLDPGPDRGVVELRGVTFTARGQGSAAGKSVGRTTLENVLANNPEIGREPSLASVKPGLIVFTSRDADPLDPIRIGGRAAREAFERDHPGLRPVLTIADEAATYTLFDPALERPDRSGPVVGQPWPDGARAVVATDLPGAGRPPGWLNRNVDGSGGLLLAPLFAKGGPGPVAHQVEGVRQHPAEDCLTCEGAAPCFLVYRIAAPQGIEAVAVRTYPRLYGDWRLANRYRLSLSTDGRTFEPLDTMRSNASGRWDGWRVPRFVWKKLALPAQEIYLRIDLSGDGVQLWSTGEFSMLVLAGLPAWPDARGVPAGEVPGAWQFVGRRLGNSFDLLRSY